MDLTSTPKLLARAATALPDAKSRQRRGGRFALVENLWHLADLEAEGFGARIARLLAEEDPFLPDFDGERIAAERKYLEKELAPAVAAFAEARAANLKALAAVTDWTRRGRQEGVGEITLRDLPARMLDHDLAHCNELADLLEEYAPGHPLIGDLRNDGPRDSRSI
jgi:hypothetical protein